MSENKSEDAVNDNQSRMETITTLADDAYMASMNAHTLASEISRALNDGVITEDAALAAVPAMIQSVEHSMRCARELLAPLRELALDSSEPLRDAVELGIDHVESVLKVAVHDSSPSVGNGVGSPEPTEGGPVDAEVQTWSLLDAYSLHLANTVSGDYDVRSPLPKPLHVDPATGRIVRGYPDIKRIIGFTSDPDETDDVMTWGAALALGTFNRFRNAIVGKFPVVTDPQGRIATIAFPITKITNNGVEL